MNEALPEKGVRFPVENPATAGPLPGDFTTVPPADQNGCQVAEKLRSFEIEFGF